MSAPRSDKPKPKIGEILLRRNVIAPQALKEALTAQGASLLPLGSTLLRLGMAAEEDVVLALAEQHGVPGVVLGRSTLQCEALGLVPERIAAGHRILPLAVEGATLKVALANPADQVLLDEIAFASGKKTLPFVAARAPLEDAVRRGYVAKGDGAGCYPGPDSTHEDVHLEVVQPTPPTPPIEPELSQQAADAFPKMPPPRPRADNAKPRVLVVDDEEAILDIIDRALTHKGMEVVRATRGREALEQLRATNPDLVLLDAMLPEIHGFEICAQIKRSEQYGHTPVIIISAVYTGWNLIQDVKAMYRADDYMTKPFRIMELVRKVEETLAKAKGRPPSPEQAEVHRTVEDQLRRAGEAARAGQMEDALHAAQAAVTADPFDARAHFTLGTTLHRAGRVYEAISEYERVVELAPSQFNALKNLAVLYERQGFKSKAVELWMRALNASPSDAVRETIKAHLIGLL
jgi:DNA-binding response OmpR family regulator